MAQILGKQFEREIREQPEVWERVARGSVAAALAERLVGEIVLVGSGSSLFAAQLGAQALRRRGITAHALAASEALRDHRAYVGRTVVALSQSGASTDLLRALDVLAPAHAIALTNTVASPLGERAETTLDVGAGPERAIPATKSVTATIAILLAAASHLGGEHPRTVEDLLATAACVRAWLARERHDEMLGAANAIAARHDVVFLGTAYGAPIAREAALKFKEATYLHAEGFEAGEFRHGSAAMVDATTALVGIVDADAMDVVGRPLRELEATGALRFAIGGVAPERVARLGPEVGEAYDTLGWLVTIHLLALYVARARGIESDAPRGLTKALL
ncbi:MAG: SIS domain-containing protein [bacterium]|nr:SIS domain-containing protein [bacterium]